MDIRVASTEDFPAMQALLGGSALPVEGVKGRERDFVVAAEAGEIVGLAGLERYGDAGLMRSVVVAPGRQGEGIARRLCDRIIEGARAGGIEQVYLLTTDADGYFAMLGFERADRDSAPPAIRSSEEFSSLCPDSAILMVRAPS